MPTKKPRVTFAISEEQLSEVESYRTSNKLKNQSQAILSLIEKGLSDFLPEKIEKLNPPLDKKEGKLVEMYQRLNEEGQERLLETADDMVRSGKYKKGRAAKLGKKEA